MISLVEFLNHVLPSEGKKCWVSLRKKDDGSVDRRQTLCDTIDELVAGLRNADAEKRNAYMACAAFKTKDNRKQENALGAQSLWVDIDAGPNKPYLDADAAIVAVDAFCDKADLPYPTIVHSGNGVHCWWTFEEMIPADMWMRVAKGFKRLTELYELHADPTRTADISSILRGPGTYNWKNPDAPLAVYCDELMARIPDLKAFCLKMSITAPTLPPQLPSSTINIAADASNIYQNADPSYAYKAVEQCGQMKFMRDMVGNIDEPLWYANLCVLAHCEDGEKAAHDWSCGHPSYSYEETKEKLSHARTKSGPTTCQKFKSINPKGCEGCPFSITSPIVLGRGTVVTPVPPPVKVEDRPALPHHFRWGPNMELFRDIIVDKEPQVIHVADPAIYLLGGRKSAIGEAKRGLVFRKWLPHEGWNTFEISEGEWETSRWLERFGEQAVHFAPDSVKHFRKYVYEAQRMMRMTTMDDNRYDSWGWTEDFKSFVCGNTLFKNDGTVTPAGISPKIQSRSNLLMPSRNGSLAGWTNIASKMFGKGMQAQGATILASLGAPFMKFASAEEGGAVLSLVSEKSGKGKTTVLRAASSVWGKMDALNLKDGDTLNAKFGTMGQVRNVPLVFDEIAAYDAPTMQSFIRTFTNGKDKSRCDRNGVVSHAIGNWQTVLICASNSSILDSLTIGTADPQASRVIEFIMDDIAFSQSGAMMDMFEQNCGFAGPTLMAYASQKAVVDHMRYKSPEDPGYVNKLIEKYSLLITADPNFRFGIRLIVCCHIGGYIAKKLGLIDFDPDYILSWMVEQMQTRVKLQADISSWSVVRSIINENSVDCLVVMDKFHPQKPANIKELPRRALRMRREINEGRLFISARQMQAWLLDAKKPYNSVVKNLMSANILINPARMTKLGAGSTLLSVSEPCWELDISDPEISGELSLIQSPAQILVKK